MAKRDELPSHHTTAIVAGIGGERSNLTDIEVLGIDLGKTVCSLAGLPKETPALDIELEDLPAELRWREWMGRIEAVIFASTSPVGRDDLARVVGQDASVDLLVEDI